LTDDDIEEMQSEIEEDQKMMAALQQQQVQGSQSEDQETDAQPGVDETIDQNDQQTWPGLGAK
jgi:hypothetical protein